ncbi:putative expansin-B2 [Silene latifolia]|uniref:putative expansin-B2 n=1 Tax=Silene latifolia TaxID=37657 RepID=UPI003D7778B9
MALNYSFSTTFYMLLASLVLLECCQCFNPKLMNVTMYDQVIDANWGLAGATWYGPPRGAGSDGGACGYRDAVGHPPFSAMISAGGPSIYQSGQGCGVCYQVKCTGNSACSGNPVTVTVTDECPGCTSEAFHFDLSGTAFGAMAKRGMDDQLRNAGVLKVQFSKVGCNYPGVTVAVSVDPGSNPYYFASTIEFEDGKGIAKVEVQPQSKGWMNMFESHGATWAINPGYVLQAPLSLRLTEKETGRTLVLDRVIPVGWKPGQTYRSRVNFH